MLRSNKQPSWYESMEVLRGGTVFQLLLCTASHEESCQIVSQLVTWNKLLLRFGFEIRENPEKCNQLCITNSTTPSIVGILHEEDRLQCQELLEWLLTNHRCIASVSIGIGVFSTEIESLSLLKAVGQNRWIKTVSIEDIDTFAAASTLRDILAYRTGVENLHLKYLTFSQDIFAAPLCVQQETSICLHSLHITGKFAEGDILDPLFTALLRNATVKTPFSGLVT
ncbi:hypothetical protein MRX96_058944 [Rhipicephalus microplus]